ncbi:MAG: hypothetical protein EZS28_004245 [Streblomastix strix]|uniref:Uncharacterized protein n=1 Tax=Streblomastix strix TaxID=222440 RepID=A0A5J4WYN0_9EUKA|nr:MAG: hypothetical protein EZS28_004243 [Streblomastix strix]KAA6400230.1 MAG: hypothetical protein EZS28_004245 [Streblomastix strix]
MESDYLIQNAANAIISFTDSYTKIKQGKQNEQQKSDSISSLTEISSCLKSINDQIRNINTSKQVIQIPKIHQSLSTLSLYKVGNHIGQEIDRQIFTVRSSSRDCLSSIRFFGDEQVQSELVNQGFGRMICISFCTAGGVGEEQDEEIEHGLYRIYRFLKDLHEGRYYRKHISQPLPLLVRNTEEQIEEEGAYEEIEAQMKNKGYYGEIKCRANDAKAVTLNHFIITI